MYTGPNITTTGLVYGYDTGIGTSTNTISTRLYPGEPTINLHPNSQDASLWTGNLFGNWINSSVTSNVSIAPDGTLTADRLGNGYGRFNASATAIPGQSYTYSIYLRNVSLTNNFDIVVAWGLNGGLVTYGGQVSVNVSQLSTSDWTRIITTATAPSSGINQVQFGPCPFTGYGNPSGQQIDVWGAQIEQKNRATPYVIGTRSATQALIDADRITTIDLSNVSFNSSAQPTFDGTDDYINFTAPGLGGTATIEMIARIGSGYTGKMLFGWLYYDVWCSNGHMGYNTGNGDVYGISSSTVSSLGIVGNYKHFIFEMRSDTSYTNNKIYVNAVNQSLSQIQSSEGSGNRNFNSGNGRLSSWRGDLNYVMPMDCPVFRVYNRALTQTEINQNFLGYRRRFGI